MDTRKQAPQSNASAWLLGLLLSGAAIPALFPVTANAELSVETIADFTLGPVVSASSAPPMVTLTASQDHQLYFPAYNDYTDLDPAAGDGLETTYKHAIDYYGYFDSYKCYAYDSGTGIFEPTAITVNKYCSGTWSGNFLNWATMTRIDTVRKMLFGGLRAVDTAGTTVLERSFLTTDAHSFAKYYDGNDIPSLTPFAPPVANSDLKKNGITFCNTSGLSGALESQNATEPPLIRVASGNYSLWAANDTWQCLWDGEKAGLTNGNVPSVTGVNAHPTPPDPPGVAGGDGLLEMVARVRACVPGLVGREQCKEYPAGNLKPVGLLQKYGEDDLMLFAMMVGSYSKNTSGGTIAREMGSISEEVNTDTDGTFTLSVTGQGPGWGAINAWSLYRITDYKYRDGSYGSGGDGSCADNVTDISTNRCRNWGNPFAEILNNTLRYYAGQDVTGQYRANDSNLLKDLNTPQVWDTTYLNLDNFCSPLVSVNFNTSVISYDGDELDGTSYGVQEYGAPMDSAGLTNVVGAGEGINTGNYFVGSVAGVGDNLCTPKAVSGLGEVSGLCPEGARLAGTAKAAGLAWYSHVEDINPLKGFQNVDHYSVPLSTAAPKVDIVAPGGNQIITVLPACRNLNQQGTPGNCGLADFKVLEQNQSAGTGRLLVVWDQSEQGGNYDQDMWGTIDWTIDGGEITVETQVFEATPRASERLGFGYVIGGTTEDGFHAHSGINGFDYDEPSVNLPGCENCQQDDGRTAATFTLGAASAQLLRDPLWYAAKWGGFTDRNGNKIPDLQEEWDRFDANGDEIPDGIPDNLFFAIDPAGLAAALESAFLAILKRISSGTSAAVVANSSKGIGAAYQALYQPKRDDQFDNEVSWLGTVQSLWVDSFGLLREDNPGGTPNGVLEDYATDPVVEFFYDEVDQRTKFRRFSSSDANEFNPSGFLVHELEEISTIWNAREQLSALSELSLDAQRSYTANASGGRHMTTWIDEDLDGLIDAGEHKDFIYSGGPGGISDNTAFFLNVESTAEAENLVRYIRGVELPNHRSRTLDYDGDGLLETMRMGDIIHSTPTLVGPPSEAFDLLYGDLSYAAFLNANKDRRHVVIVGGNDGMIRALNAGFFDIENQTFSTTGPAGTTSHPLGSELWAYVPGNVLPHLRWLKSQSYSHVFYVDGKPRVFDAKIRNGSDWGTFMVVPMRLGTGRITTDTQNDGFDGDDDLTSYPAYIVMDITDPEQPPTVLAEIVLSNPSYTTAEPTVAVFRDPAGLLNEWYLVLGSGPTDLRSAATSQNLFVEIHDLAQMALGQPSHVRTISQIGGDAQNSFAGDLITADWDLDFLTDAIYFGGIKGGSDGAFWKLDTNSESSLPSSWSLEKYFDTDRPVTARPSLGLDEFGIPYVFFGTGRIFSNNDKSSVDPQRIYGVKDIEFSRNGSLPVSIASLEDITGIQIFEDGSVENGPAGITTFAELTNFFDDPTDTVDGWYRNLPADGISASPRVVSSSVLLGGVLLQPVFTPGSDQCGAEGTSQLFGLFFKTGTGSADPNILGTVPGIVNGDGAELVETVIDLGIGLGASPSLHVGEGTGENEATSFVQTSTGTIIRSSVVTLFPVDSGEVSWREMDP